VIGTPFRAKDLHECPDRRLGTEVLSGSGPVEHDRLQESGSSPPLAAGRSAREVAVMPSRPIAYRGSARAGADVGRKKNSGPSQATSSVAGAQARPPRAPDSASQRSPTRPPAPWRPACKRGMCSLRVAESRVDDVAVALQGIVQALVADALREQQASNRRRPVGSGDRGVSPSCSNAPSSNSTLLR